MTWTICTENLRFLHVLDFPIRHKPHFKGELSFINIDFAQACHSNIVIITVFIAHQILIKVTHLFKPKVIKKVPLFIKKYRVTHQKTCHGEIKCSSISKLVPECVY